MADRTAADAAVLGGEFIEEFAGDRLGEFEFVELAAEMLQPGEQRRVHKSGSPQRFKGAQAEVGGIGVDILLALVERLDLGADTGVFGHARLDFFLKAGALALLFDQARRRRFLLLVKPLAGALRLVIGILQLGDPFALLRAGDRGGAPLLQFDQRVDALGE